MIVLVSKIEMEVIMKVYLIMVWRETNTTWEYDCLFSTRETADAYVKKCVDEDNPYSNFMILENEVDKYKEFALK